MKLRCTHNSVRIRVRKSDLQSLEEHSKVEESIQFGPNKTLTFGISMDNRYSTVRAAFVNDKVSIELPASQASQWINSNQVGIESSQDLSGGEALHILIEKDFPCLDREEENKSDTFWELAPDQPEAC